MNNNHEAFLKKSRENLEVCDSAMAAGNFNAAASRYYYACRLAAISYFWANEIKPPDLIKKGTEWVDNVENEWRHIRLIKEVGERLNDDLDAESLLFSAKELREKGDYTDVDVDPVELPSLMARTDSVLKVLLRVNE